MQSSCDTKNENSGGKYYLLCSIHFNDLRVLYNFKKWGWYTACIEVVAKHRGEKGGEKSI